MFVVSCYCHSIYDINPYNDDAAYLALILNVYKLVFYRNSSVTELIFTDMVALRSVGDTLYLIVTCTLML